MCLAVPMQIKHIEGFDARCSARGVERDVSLFMLQEEPVSLGDWVLVHVGYAIQVISAEEAGITWDLFDQMTAGAAAGA
jgi:hydrogenase expression/formation protein HypC